MKSNLKSAKMLLLIITVATVFFIGLESCSKKEVLFKNQDNSPRNLNRNLTKADTVKQLSDFTDPFDHSVVQKLQNYLIKIRNPYKEENNAVANNGDILVNFDNIRYYNTSIGKAFVIYEEPKISDPYYMYGQSDSLVNVTDNNIYMQTVSFKETVTTTVTNKLLRGFKLGVYATATVNIPIAGTTISIATEFNLDKENDTSNTTSRVYTYPSQNVLVPAHHTYLVQAIIQKQRMTTKTFVQIPINTDGALVLQTNSDPAMPVVFESDRMINLFNRYFPDEASEYPIFTKDEHGKFVYRSAGALEADYGMSLDLVIKDITKIKGDDYSSAPIVKVINLKKFKTN